MDSALGCGPEQAAASSNAVATRVGSTSAPERLRRRSDLAAVFSEGRRRRTAGITVISLPRPGMPTRIAYVASRAVGTAVDRNRAKRRLREAVRSLRAPEGHDMIIIASREVLDAPFSELRSSLEGAWKKLV